MEFGKYVIYYSSAVCVLNADVQKPTFIHAT